MSAPRLRDFVRHAESLSVGHPSPWLFILYLRTGSYLFPLYGFDPRFVIGFEWSTIYGAWFVTRRTRLWLRWFNRVRITAAGSA